MSDNGQKPPLAFQRSVPLVGQPFTVLAFSIPVNVTLTCHCAEQALQIVGGQPATCPQCGKVYQAAYNPQTGQLNVQIGIPQTEQVVS